MKGVDEKQPCVGSVRFLSERMEKPTDKNPKRPRDPLEENIPPSDELEVVLKRRCLAAGGVENHNPEEQAGPVRSPARSRRVESEVKPDTPAIASVRLRVQQLTQRRDGGAALVQRCMSDPGGESPSSTLLRDVCHIGEGEFSSRLERFKTPTPKTSPAPATPNTRHLSSLVHNMQQQLNATMTPSTKEASRMRQAREDELKSLRVQPLTENMWLKRSSSDPSLAEDDSGTDLKESEPRLNFSVVNETMGDGFSATSSFSTEMQPPDTALCPPESMVRPHAEMSTSALIDKMFEDVLQAADGEKEDVKEQEEERQNDSHVSESRGEADVETAETEPKLTPPDQSLGGNEACDEEQRECENQNEEEAVAGEREENTACNEDFLSLPPSCVLSPLSKSVEAAITLMGLTTTEPPPIAPCDPAEEVATPPAPPLYSVDEYRSQTKNLPPSSQTVSPGVQKQRAEKSDTSPAVNTKEIIKALSDEASKLQTVINQTLQALSCCSDEEHGKGSLQEAEAEKLLLVSSEKHAALLAEISLLREGGAGREPDSRPDRLQPCRGTISINNIQLPLKVEFVCSARTARPTHYFFVLIRYGACNIVATPLATAADAENGDTITFPTSITLQDIRSNFEIDVEVYSLSNSVANSSSANVQQHRSSMRLKATPKKLLSSIKKSNPCSTSGASSALDPRRSSNFSLVGSHRITLSSLGQTKFLLDKMKFEGKIRQLLGDEFQEKVPFLSPLEGHIYLQLHSESHSNVYHQGFLTMFEYVSGFGAWQRLSFKLEGGVLYYWKYPNEMCSKSAEGSISLWGFDSVRAVQRDSCAWPHTFELVNSRTLQQDHTHTLAKSWFSADTREGQADWMEKLNQVLLDLHTWSWRAAGEESDQANTSSVTAMSRESFL
ncbi:anillin, actin binding protein 2 [Neoarius graeffei]|uniref:anillin, actin binding protein 2 n=1 Tax=Neoarius graeffei TaxID=443677 RepID=UPI00298C5B74|nr:anillin, actin binding protein 2 [Neoarius graeffei]